MGSDSLIKNIINQKDLHPLVTEVSMGEGLSYINDVLPSVEQLIIIGTEMGE